MPLTPGTRLGPYVVEAAIGAGGMGEVYRARDTKLGRDVALKILPDEFAQDPGRLARFEREAQTLAALNHPHIAQIYGLEGRALVMELVDGEDLSTRIARGPIAPAEVMAIARQLADALGAAHEAGIIHRDLKPANIKISDDGTIKVLDFGLAKAAADSQLSAASAPGGYQAVTSPAMTQMGVIIGTAAYMAPEQAKGRPVDRRADVWAFGVVVYEMLTGRRLFGGEDVSDTLAAVLTREPNFGDLPPGTPPSLRRVLGHALVKNPRARLDSMSAIKFDLDDVPATSSTATAASRSSLTLAVLVVASLATGAILSRWLWPSSSPGSPTDRAVVASSIIAAPEAVSAFTHGFALSPDGTRLVYAARTVDGRRRLWRRALADPRAEAIPGTEDAVYPFWSPDGRDVGFFAAGVLKRVPADGGPARIICEAPGPWPRGSWNQRDEILFSVAATEGSGLFRVSASGGQPAKLDLRGRIYAPQWLPDGRHFLYAEQAADRATLFASSGEAGQPPKAVLDLATGAGDPDARFSPAGFLVFNRAGALSLQRFDAASLETSGPIVVIGDKAGAPRGWLAVSLAGSTLVALNPPTGTIGGTPGDPLSSLRWIDRQGRVLSEVGTPARYWTMRLSHDGLRAAINPTDDVWTIDTRTGLRTRIGPASGAVWSADDRELIGRSDEGLWIKPSSGEGEARSVLTFKERTLVPDDVTPDGTLLIVSARPTSSDRSFDLLLVTLRDGSIRSFLSTASHESQASVSPEGRWVAYASDPTGRAEVYVRPLAGEGVPVRLSADGGQHPLWRRDGRELFFMSPTDEIVSIDLSAFGRTGVPGDRRVLFRVVMNDITSDNYSPFAVSPDGQRFLVNVATAPEPLTLMQRLDRLIPSR